jgi:phospholipid/cholesterol/gamma-HCH transport system substrate-binding protein
MTPARLAGIGAFVIGGIVLFAVGLFLIGERRMLFVRKFDVNTEFTKVSGLQPGASVKVNGMPAGEVTAILPPAAPGGRFSVRFNVREDLHPLVRTDSLASIQTEGLVGGTFLEITAGTRAAPELRAGGAIPSREPFEVADLMIQMSETVRLVNETIGSLRGDVELAISEIAETATHADTLLENISDDVARISASGRRITEDTQAMIAGVRQGRGTLGKLLSDDALYRRAATIASEAEAIVKEARRTVQEGREALASLRSDEGPGQVVADMRETLGHARDALANLEENSEALKHNFFFRGYFKRRGYFDLEDISPAEYRAGVLERDDRRALRIWLDAAVLFERTPDGRERLSADGRVRVESAMSVFLEYGPDAPLIVEGYATDGATSQQYLAARARAAVVRQYLLDTFQRNPAATGIMPLGADAPGSPQNGRWNGVAIALFVPRQ